MIVNFRFARDRDRVDYLDAALVKRFLFGLLLDPVGDPGGDMKKIFEIQRRLQCLINSRRD